MVASLHWFEVPADRRILSSLLDHEVVHRSRWVDDDERRDRAGEETRSATTRTLHQVDGVTFDEPALASSGSARRQIKSL